jgi:hypothetical protein
MPCFRLRGRTSRDGRRRPSSPVCSVRAHTSYRWLMYRPRSVVVRGMAQPVRA